MIYTNTENFQGVESSKLQDDRNSNRDKSQLKAENGVCFKYVVPLVMHPCHVQQGQSCKDLQRSKERGCENRKVLKDVLSLVWKCVFMLLFLLIT